MAVPLSAEPCQPSLRGHVYDKESGMAIPGITVKAQKLASRDLPSVQAITNRDGFYEFPNLDPQGWWVTLLRPDQIWSSMIPSGQECGSASIYVSQPSKSDPKGAQAAKACKLSLRGYVYHHESFTAMPGHIVRATNGTAVATAVANRDGYFEFLNLSPGNWWLTTDMTGFKPAILPRFATLREDTGCANRNLYLQPFGRREQLEEAIGSIPGYAVALFQLVKEALGAR